MSERPLNPLDFLYRSGGKRNRSVRVNAKKCISIDKWAEILFLWSFIKMMKEDRNWICQAQIDCLFRKLMRKFFSYQSSNILVGTLFPFSLVQCCNRSIKRLSWDFLHSQTCDVRTLERLLLPGHVSRRDFPWNRDVSNFDKWCTLPSFLDRIHLDCRYLSLGVSYSIPLRKRWKKIMDFRDEWILSIA